jgi:hypothetical protein
VTSALFSSIDELPDAPEKTEDLFGTVSMEDDEKPVRRTRAPRKPREKKYDADGNEVKATRVTSTARLNEDLLETTVSIASDISAFAPTVAGVLVARAEVTVDGLTALAKGKPRTTAALKKVASVGKIAGLLEVGLLLFVAGMADFGKIPANSPILDRIGYAEIIRDEKGKALKDDHGMVAKQRTTIRDIRRSMGIDDDNADDASLSMPAWNLGAVGNPLNSGMGPDTHTGPIGMAPMNWQGRS